MNKQGKTYIIIAIIAILSMVVLEYTKPQRINWYPSYAKQHKIPFGTYVFNDQLERLLSKENIVNIDRPPYEYLNKNDINGTYLFINNTMQFDETELESLLDWTSKGNTLFIASEGFNEKLLDTLSLKNKNLFNYGTNFHVQLKNKQLIKDSLYTFEKDQAIHYFNKIDTLNTKVLGIINSSNKIDSLKTKITNLVTTPVDSSQLYREHINIIKQPFGNGQIILSMFPQAFTNYFMLKAPNQNYTAGLISYIDNSKPLYLDNYYKSGKSFYSSPMHVLLNNNALKWAYYIMLIGVFIYVVFEGKRKQRAIPIVEPLKNQTVNFTRTIANMYYENNKHGEIAQHKIQHFLDFIRTHLHLNTNTFNDDFIKNLAARSNNSIEDTQKLFKIITDTKAKTQLNDKELERLNTLIETFKSNNKWTIKT